MRPRSSNPQQVGLVLAGEVVLEITHQVLEDVNVLAPGAHHSEALHEHGPILASEFIPVSLAGIGDEAAHIGVVFRAVGHQGQLVCCMERDQTARSAFVAGISVQR